MNAWHTIIKMSAKIDVIYTNHKAWLYMVIVYQPAIRHVRVYMASKHTARKGLVSMLETNHKIHSSPWCRRYNKCRSHS